MRCFGILEGRGGYLCWKLDFRSEARQGGCGAGFALVTLIHWRAFRSLHGDLHIVRWGYNVSLIVSLKVQLPIMHQPVDPSLRPVMITFDCGDRKPEQSLAYEGSDDGKLFSIAN